MSLRSVKVRDHMVRKPILVHPDTRLFEAVNAIIEHRISGVTVVNAEQRVAGMLSELDCLRAILSGVYYQQEASIVDVGEHMVTDVECVTPDEDIIDVAQSMLDHKHRRRPVVDGDGRMVGQLTCRSILAAVKDFNNPR
ncbi:MAG: CBS domain-containing protein [Pseudomonadota bacterium]